jgi:hypothetical protein
MLGVSVGLMNKLAAKKHRFFVSYRHDKSRPSDYEKYYLLEKQCTFVWEEDLGFVVTSCDITADYRDII